MNAHGVEVPNARCPICAESRAAVTYAEHSEHVDYIASVGKAEGYASPGWTAERYAAGFKANGGGRQRGL